MANSQMKKLPIFHAGSLNATFAKINAEFKKLHPEVETISEAAGSADAVRWITEQKRECGILASADYKLIPEMMFPDFASWYIIFAADQLVLCYSDKSKYHEEINAGNWYQILQRPEVICANHDPQQDPGGYRTLMVWQLAEKYYKVPRLYQKLVNSPGYKIMPGNLIGLCAAGQIDYTFVYGAVAIQNKAKYISLPDNVNLANRKFGDFYSKAEIKLRGSGQGETITIKGEPVLFALTIPKSYPNQEMAINWVSFLLGRQGTEIMTTMGMKPFSPAVSNSLDLIPLKLKKYVS